MRWTSRCPCLSELMFGVVGGGVYFSFDGVSVPCIWNLTVSFGFVTDVIMEHQY
jgi:phage shock protein PspC (stress-responsive transcriptional regulator)